MYRSIWKAFFVLFFKPCLSTCFCLFKYSYCFYLILSHLTYKRKQMCMQTEIIISLMYSLTLRETLLCWLWMPWLRTEVGSGQMCAWFVCAWVCVCVCVRWEAVKVMGGKKWSNEFKRLFQVPYLLFMLALPQHLLWTSWMSNWNVCGRSVNVYTCRQKCFTAFENQCLLPYRTVFKDNVSSFITHKIKCVGYITRHKSNHRGEGI